jgi:uncharacterized repeat protein (TIGR01451 family)
VRSGSAVLIQENEIYNVLGEKKDGIHIEPGATATIVANTVYSAAADGITFNGTVGTISSNDLHDNGASGIDVDADAVTIMANRVFGNGQSGIEVDRAGQFTLSNNLVGGNVAGGIWVAGAAQGRVVNNTLVGLQSDPVHRRLGTLRLGVGLRVLSDTVTLTSANNIIISHTMGISVVAGAQVTTTFDNVWSNNINFSGIISGAGSIEQDPRLANVNNYDYHLLWGSPCIDAGWAPLASEFPLDFEGHPRFGRIEIGADEVGIQLIKKAPAYAIPGALISYTIMISNQFNVTLTNVVITDALPSGAHWVSAQNGGSLLIDDVVVWTVDSIGPIGGVAQVGFVVTASETITNDRYRVVTSTQGISTGVGPAVVTWIAWPHFLPIILTNHGS